MVSHRVRAPFNLPRFARALLLIPALCLALPAAAVDDSSAAWLGVQRSGNFTGENWSSWLYMAQTEYRRFDALEGTRLAMVRGGLGYRFDRNWRAFVQADYRYTYTPELGTFREKRLREMLLWAGPGWASTTLRLRFLLEQRWIDERRGTGWRFRPRVRVDFPIQGRPGVNGIVFAETFHDLRSTDWVDSGWNEKRLFLGARLPLRSGLDVETGYLAQWIDPFGTGDRLSHTLVAMFRFH